MASDSGRSCSLLLRGGMVVDGTGARARRAEVAVLGDRIAAVGELGGWQAERVLETRGLVVAPGFIDMHTHSDLSLLINPRAESKLRQGVTTEVTGMCGFSPAPAPADRRAVVREMFGKWGRAVDWTWGSFGDYLEALRKQPASVNLVPVVGHGVVRAGAMGEEDRPPTGTELDEMRRLVRESVEQGALGLSTGLIYAPGMFAETHEIIALAREVAPLGGIYFTHIRGEDHRLLGAVREAIEIGRQAGVGMQIAHMKTEGKANWGKAGPALEAISAAREEGLDVSFDVYPYTAWNTGLAQMLPTWAREGGREAMLARLADAATRERLWAEIAPESASEPDLWERRLVSAVESAGNRDLQGLTLAQIAARRGVPPQQVVMDLLLEERGHVSMVGFGMDEEDIKQVLAHPAAMVGSDASAVAPYGLLGEDHPHPRAYGTFPRVLGRFVRELGVLSLEEAVAKMTGRPATRLGLRDRGLIAAGQAADLVVFDPDTITDQATYDRPHQYPTGIRWVIVNGVVELDGDTHCDHRPGRVLARA